MLLKHRIEKRRHSSEFLSSHPTQKTNMRK